jgi:ATP-dependent DNA helicase RecQ
MSLSLEPEILQEWLAQFNLSLETLTGLPEKLQTDLLLFLLPEEKAGFDEKTRTGLFILGRTIGTKISYKEKSKSTWRVLFRLFLDLNEPAPAAYAFHHIWPAPDPTKITYFSELVQLYLAQGKVNSAEETIKEMRELFPARFTTYVTEAEIFLYQQNLNGARVAYLEGLETSPSNHRLMLSLADTAYKQNQFEEAAAWLEEAERHSEDKKILSLKVARLWEDLGENEKAARIYEDYALLKQQKQILLYQNIQAACQEIKTDLQPGGPAAFDLIGETTFRLEPGDLAAPVTILTPETAQPTEALPKSAYQALKEVFGFDEFRPGQEPVIANILAGFDTLAILPTGAGKSLCYQLPALLLDRPVLVLSPLISLMKDQFDKLPGALKEHTLIINSSLEPLEAARRLHQLSQPGHSVRLIYAAPERLRQAPFIQALSKGGLGLVVVDEAHCVTMWGNDFRPDYLFIRQALTGLNTPLLAVTATATSQVAQEITRELGRNFKIVRGSVFRSNLRFSVEKIVGGIQNRLDRVVKLCKALPGSGIIYTRSREKCESVADFLRNHGLNARPYHAGMDNTARQRVQESWTSGQTSVIVATIAFGMGIDKPDVRYIIHFNPATSLENYMQEAGRAGRDGQPASCIMLYSSNDKANLSRWLREENEQIDLEILREVYRIIARKLGRERRGIISMNEILAGSYSSFPPPDEGLIRVTISLLAGAGLLERGFDLPLVTRVSLPDAGSPDPLPSEVVNFYHLSGLAGSSPVTIDLVSLAFQMAISPPELDARLLDWHEAGFLNYQAARREPYLELKAAGSDVRSRLENLLSRRQLEAGQRLEKLSTYLKSRACRQVLLANHFGERLNNRCGNCDNCTGGESNLKMAQNPEPAQNKPLQPVKPVPKYSPDEITANILGCLALVTGGAGQVGRSGLVNLLLGKRSAFGTTANNPYKGKFEAFRIKEAENLVEKLVLTGLIEEHPAMLISGRTYQAIRVSDKGQLWLDDHRILLP